MLSFLTSLTSVVSGLCLFFLLPVLLKQEMLEVGPGTGKLGCFGTFATLVDSAEQVWNWICLQLSVPRAFRSAPWLPCTQVLKKEGNM